MEEIIVSIMEMLMNWESILGLVLYIPVAILIGLLTLVIAVGPWIVLIIVLVRFGKSKKVSKKMKDFAELPMIDGMIDMTVGQIIEEASRMSYATKVSESETRFKVDAVTVSFDGLGLSYGSGVAFSKLGMKNLHDPIKLNDMCVAVGDQIKERLRNSPFLTGWDITSKMVAAGVFVYQLTLTKPNSNYVPLQSWDGDPVQKVYEKVQNEDQQRLSQMQDRKHAEERKKNQEIQQQAEIQEKLDALHTRFEKSPYTERIANDAITRITPSVNDQLRRLSIQQKELNITCTLRVQDNRVDFVSPLDQSFATAEMFNVAKENLKPLSTDEEKIAFKDCILDKMKRSLRDMVAHGEIDEYSIGTSCATSTASIYLTKKNPSYEPPKEW